MAKPLVSDALWNEIQPILPKRERRFRYPGRRPIGDREALTGILFVLKTGIPWESLPQEMGCGCGMTCWRRLRDWQQAGVWQTMLEVMLKHLREQDRIDWSRAVVDSASVRAKHGGEKTGPNPTDRGKQGSKHHVITDGQGIPLSVQLSAANENDVNYLLPLVESIPAIADKRGHPQKRPQRVQGDRAYDSQKHRLDLRQRGIQPVLAKRRTSHGSGLGVFRWVVERTLAWLHQFRRLQVRYERRADIHEAFLTLASAMICWNFLQVD